MVKVKYTNITPLGAPENPELTLSNGRSTATFYDDQSSTEIVVEGSGFRKSGDLLSAGKVDSFLYKVEGEVAIKLTDANFSYKLMNALINSDETAGYRIFKGDDTITGATLDDFLAGYNGDDVLKGNFGDDQFYGGKGSDTMIGGDGADTFHFSTEDGTARDLIKDFDIIGSVVDSFGGDAEISKIKSFNKGHDTLVTFEHGGSVVLEGIAADEFKAFMLPPEML